VAKQNILVSFITWADPETILQVYPICFDIYRARDLVSAWKIDGRMYSTKVYTDIDY
jgi:hypothetical protein